MADAAEQTASNPQTAYEPSDWPLRPVGLIFLGIFVFLVSAPLVLIWAYPNTLFDVNRNLTVKLPAPQLQIDPAQELAKFEAEERRRLDTYYWIDKQKGIIHMPIEEAMKKLAREGIEGFPK